MYVTQICTQRGGREADIGRYEIRQSEADDRKDGQTMPKSEILGYRNYEMLIKI